LFLVGYLRGGGMNDFLDLGPIFAFTGFAVGTICNCIVLWDVFQDLQEIAKQRRNQAAAEAGPTRPCPQCGKKIPAYAGACRYCKSILS
jgi:hypothetical protein